MRIGMILPASFPPDIRVEKEIASLQSEHEIGLLCLKKDGDASKEVLGGVEISRVFSNSERRWSNWRLLTTCHSELWTRAIRKFIREYRPDALHVHDLPLLGPALEATQGESMPVIADLHENYPAMLAERQSQPLLQRASLGAWAYRIFARIERWEAYELESVAKADRVVTVIEEARDRLVSLGIDVRRIHVVGNYASMNEVDTSRDREDGDFRVLFAGSFGPTRDLETVISGVAALPLEQFKALRVELVGGVGVDFSRLKQMTAELGVSDRVSVLPWLPLAKVERMMDHADLGLVPHVKSPHTDATIPHKLFQYMWRRLPVIVSDCVPLQRIVENTESGLCYEHGNAESFAAALSRLYADRALAARMGEAGHVAVRDHYNWSQAGNELLKLYQSL